MMINTLNIYYNPRELLMKLSELTTAIAGVSAQITKAQDEILGKIAALETALIDVDLPEDAVAAIEALRGQAQVLDDIVPDVVPEPEPIETVEPVTE